ncbi:MAG: thioredoxin [Anaerolineae bacterium]|nr:thioredoxin [Anaerolineae bacterium]
MFEVTDATFKEQVLESELPTLVDFWAGWCMPCRMIAPTVEAIAEEYTGRLNVVKMDVDANPATPNGLGIRGIPTLILFKNGAEVSRVVGNQSKKALENAILPHL